MTEHPDRTEPKRRMSWNTDPTADYPLGPDDAGNAAMHAIGLVVAAWRRVTGLARRRP